MLSALFLVEINQFSFMYSPTRVNSEISKQLNNFSFLFRENYVYFD